MPGTKTMDEWKAGTLHSGSKTGPVVKNQKQAVAIMLSEKRKAGANIPKAPAVKKYSGPTTRTGATGGTLATTPKLKHPKPSGLY